MAELLLGLALVLWSSWQYTKAQEEVDKGGANIVHLKYVDGQLKVVDAPQKGESKNGKAKQKQSRPEDPSKVEAAH